MRSREIKLLEFTEELSERLESGKETDVLIQSSWTVLKPFITHLRWLQGSQ